ncbi:MAG: hypothetical protein M3362_26325 [Acidobacteriota bacterium]|nr:hypothetical protein [Acidobacteriota bacterium]
MWGFNICYLALYIAKSYPLAFALIFLIAWLGSSWLIGNISGWRSLATIYPLVKSFPKKKWSSQSAQMHWFGFYNNCLNFGVDTEGVYISIWPLFRVGHPPLFIPWSDISVRERKSVIFTFIEFEFKGLPSIPLRISKRLYEPLVKARAKTS